MDAEQDLWLRKKRAIANVPKKNESIVFHHALDELNEGKFPLVYVIMKKIND